METINKNNFRIQIILYTNLNFSKFLSYGKIVTALIPLFLLHLSIHP